VDRAETRRRVGEALDLVHLAGYGPRRPNQLSGGQQQRVALARALINQPNVLLLDEPLGALDLKLRKQLQVELKRVQTEVGITFVYVTHDQEEALTMSDRIAVMHRGRVEQLGTPEGLYERPLTRFVADFIGTTNILTGSVESIDGSVARIRLGADAVCHAVGTGLALGHTVELSVRPEGVELRATNGHAGDNAAGLAGKIEQVAYLGGSIQYWVRTDGGLTITAVTPATGDRHAVGGKVDLMWSPDKALVLAESTQAQEEVRT
jgi:spermidine/putrescine transport system ATP-binding protein